MDGVKLVRRALARPISRYGVLTLVGALSLTSTLAACAREIEKTPEQACNDAKVSAHDAWASLSVDLRPACEAFRTPEMLALRERAATSTGGFGFGGESPETIQAVGFVLGTGQVYEPLEQACASIEQARDAARGGAVPSRDASRVALDQLRAALGTVRTRSQQPPARPGDSISARLSTQGVSTVASVADRLHLESRLQQIDAVTLARWNACQSVQP